MADREDGLAARCWRSRWSPFEVGEGTIKQRQTTAQLVLGGKIVGGFQFCEYRADTFTPTPIFVEALDSYSAEAFALAMVICSHWEDINDITDYGDILELRRAWVAPAHSGGGRLSAAITAAVAALHPQHALMVLKAFPLEYECRVTDENEAAFGRRREALKRLYRAALGMRDFPDDSGEEGWMYAVPERLKALDCLMPSPRAMVPELQWF